MAKISAITNFNYSFATVNIYHSISLGILMSTWAFLTLDLENSIKESGSTVN